jgi:glycerol uptake facilitator-like aquaporin
MAVYASAGVSGAHLNPAVTLALAVHRGFPWAKVLPYSLAQLAGAFCGAALTFITYREAFAAYDDGCWRQVAGRARHCRHLRDLPAAVPGAPSEGWSTRSSARRSCC